MNNNIFVGRKLYSSLNFSKFAEYHGHLIGCELRNYYYEDSKLELIEKKNEKYYYLGTDIECLVQNYVDTSIILIGCHECKATKYYPECCSVFGKDRNFYCISYLTPILKYTNKDNLGDAINYVLEYNESLNQDLEKRLVLCK